MFRKIKEKGKDIKYINGHTASVLPLLKICQNFPDGKDDIINFNNENAEKYVKSLLYGYDSLFEITQEFYEEILLNITQNYENLLSEFEKSRCFWL